MFLSRKYSGESFLKHAKQGARLLCEFRGFPPFEEGGADILHVRRSERNAAGGISMHNRYTRKIELDEIKRLWRHFGENCEFFAEEYIGRTLLVRRGERFRDNSFTVLSWRRLEENCSIFEELDAKGWKAAVSEFGSPFSFGKLKSFDGDGVLKLSRKSAPEEFLRLGFRAVVEIDAHVDGDKPRVAFFGDEHRKEPFLDVVSLASCSKNELTLASAKNGVSGPSTTFFFDESSNELFVDECPGGGSGDGTLARRRRAEESDMTTLVPFSIRTGEDECDACAHYWPAALILARYAPHMLVERLLTPECRDARIVPNGRGEYFHASHMIFMNKKMRPTAGTCLGQPENIRDAVRMFLRAECLLDDKELDGAMDSIERYFRGRVDKDTLDYVMDVFRDARRKFLPEEELCIRIAEVYAQNIETESCVPAL